MFFDTRVLFGTVRVSLNAESTAQLCLALLCALGFNLFSSKKFLLRQRRKWYLLTVSSVSVLLRCTKKTFWLQKSCVPKPAVTHTINVVICCAWHQHVLSVKTLKFERTHSPLNKLRVPLLLGLGNSPHGVTTSPFEWNLTNSFNVHAKNVQTMFHVRRRQHVIPHSFSEWLEIAWSKRFPFAAAVRWKSGES